MLRLNQLTLIVMIVCLSMAAYAQEWIQYVQLNDRFAMMFPGVPDVEETTQLSAHGVVFPARVYSLDNRGSHYSLTVVDYTDAERRHRERPDPTDATSGERFWVMDVRASVDYEAQKIRERVRSEGSEITYEGWADIDKVEGHQMQITNTDKSHTVVSIHLNASRLYLLEATAPAAYPPPAWFQESILFLDEEGKHVRYTFDPDGQRIDSRHTPLGEVETGTRRMVVE